jgi:hypothetical protein
MSGLHDSGVCTWFVYGYFTCLHARAALLTCVVVVVVGDERAVSLAG